jgi:F-type H+-transporting ATPase subunit delta
MKTTAQTRQKAKRLFRMCMVNGRLDENRFLNMVRIVLESRHRSYLSLLAQLAKMVKLERSAHEAKIESAEPLPVDLQAGVRTSLERLYGDELEMSFAHNPALIGGMRVKIGSDVYDASVLARLGALGKSF